MKVPTARRVQADVAELPPGVTTPTGTAGRILSAALAAFAEHGFHGTSIRDIASAVGINSATLYAHFASKDAILRELVMVGHTQLDARIRAALHGADNPRDQFTAIVRADVIAHASYPLLAVVTNQELHALSPVSSVEARTIRAELQTLLNTVIREGVAEGVFRADDVDLAGRAIADMVLRIGNWYSSGRVSIEELADAYVGFALRMVAPE